VDAGSHSAELSVVNFSELVNPLAEYTIEPCSATLVSGRDARAHLNRLCTADILSDTEMSRRQSFLCDSNGRIIGHLLHADLGKEILLIHSQQVKEAVRKNIFNGIPWNEDVSVSSGDGAVHRLILVGKNPNRVILGLGVNLEDLSESTWTEYGDCMISQIVSTPNVSAYELLIPSRSFDSIKSSLEMNGAKHTNPASWRALQTQIKRVDITENTSGQMPFELGLEGLVNLRKGCYPGQEIHARMESRGALARKLVSVISDDEPPAGKHKFGEGDRIELLSIHQNANSWFSLGLISTKIEFESSNTIECQGESINATFS